MLNELFKNIIALTILIIFGFFMEDTEKKIMRYIMLKII